MTSHENRPSHNFQVLLLLVLADAPPRARKRLLQALEILDTPGYISKKKFKHVLLRVPMELLTLNHHKAARPYQTSRAERSAEYALCLARLQEKRGSQSARKISFMNVEPRD